MAAARAFKAIDAPTRGIVVPYGNAGREVVPTSVRHARTKNSSCCVAPNNSASMSSHVLERLVTAGAVREDLGELQESDPRPSAGTKFGLSETPAAEMELLNV